MSRSAGGAPAFCVLRQGKGLPPLAPHPHPRVWPHAFASLRWCSPSARNGVRLPSGMLFSIVGIPRHVSGSRTEAPFVDRIDHWVRHISLGRYSLGTGARSGAALHGAVEGGPSTAEASSDDCQA